MAATAPSGSNEQLDGQVAFLQYTSGSTSDPKGVMISHANLDHNLQLIHAGLNAGTDTVVVSWLPQYHDMGLIGSYLACIGCGGSGYYMSPISFIRNPPLWIKCISMYRGTHMQAPDFAYSLTAKKFLAMERHAHANNDKNSLHFVSEINLTCVKHMINAAEPVQKRSIDSFYSVFAEYGLRRGVVFPTYGLAEHTVYVCSNGRLNVNCCSADLKQGRVVSLMNDDVQMKSKNFPGCGKPEDSTGLECEIVVESSSGELKAVTKEGGKVGEIWIRSPSVALGYWGMEGKVENENFRGVIPGKAGYYLRTGDMGFLQNDELVVCGRKKDLILVRGKNHYPQDIERSAEAVNTRADGKYSGGIALRPGCSAAFSMTFRNKEGLALVSEVSDELFKNGNRTKYLEHVISKIRSEVAATHGISPSYIALLKPRSIYKTTSGKISRSKVSSQALENKLENKLYLWEEVEGDSTAQSQYSFLDDEMDGSAPCAPNTEAIMDLREGGVAAVDPTGMKMEKVQKILAEEVYSALESEHGSAVRKIPINWNAPVMSLGIDSMMGIQLVGNLECRFTIPIPEKLFADPGCTLNSVAQCLIAGGRVRPRPYMINSWQLVPHMLNAIRCSVEFEAVEWDAKPAEYKLETLSQRWIHANAIKADFETFRFPSGIAKASKPLTPEQNQHVHWVQWITIILKNENLMSIVRWVPHVLFCMVFFSVRMWSLKLLALVICHWVSNAPNRFLLYDSLIDTRNLITFQCSKILALLVEYFSHRIIIETPIDIKSAPVMCLLKAYSVERFDNATVKLHTGGVAMELVVTTFLLLHAFIRFIHGFQVVSLLPQFFYVVQEMKMSDLEADPPLEYREPPAYSQSYFQNFTSSAWMRLGFMGSRSAKELLDDETTQGRDGRLQHYHHLSLMHDTYDQKYGENVPNSVGNVEAIRLALIKGYQIVPCVHLHDRGVATDPETSVGAEDADHEARGMIYRKNLTLVMGRPIQCPRVVKTPNTLAKNSKERPEVRDLSIVTDELVQEYNDMYVNECQRIAKSYQNFYA